MIGLVLCNRSIAENGLFVAYLSDSCGRCRCFICGEIGWIAMDLSTSSSRLWTKLTWVLSITDPANGLYLTPPRKQKRTKDQSIKQKTHMRIVRESARNCALQFSFLYESDRYGAKTYVRPVRVFVLLMIQTVDVCTKTSRTPLIIGFRQRYVAQKRATSRMKNL